MQSCLQFATRALASLVPFLPSSKYYKPTLTLSNNPTDLKYTSPGTTVFASWISGSEYPQMWSYARRFTNALILLLAATMLKT